MQGAARRNGLTIDDETGLLKDAYFALVLAIDPDFYRGLGKRLDAVFGTGSS